MNSVQDVVFFSLNFKGTYIKQLDSSCFSYSCQISEIGISTLDTRDIDIGDPNIHTVHYVDTGATIRSPKPKAIFGTYINITGYHPWQKEHLLYSLFYVPETRDLYDSQFRKVVFVGHDVNSQIEFLWNIGFKLRQIHTVIGVLNAQTIGREVLGTDMSLENLLQKLICPHRYLKNAGDYAYFTLRATFLLAYQHWSEPPHLSDSEKAQWHKKVLWMRDLAFEPISGITNGAMKAMKNQNFSPTFDWTDIVDVFELGEGSIFQIKEQKSE